MILLVKQSISLVYRVKGMATRTNSKRGYPITSYGIILFVQRKEDDSKLEPIKRNFLLYQRRDTYEYIEFIRGMWETIDEVKIFFSLMSNEERRRIQNHTFEELWDDFWIRHNSGMNDHTLIRSRTKYSQIQPYIKDIIKETKSEVGEEAPWGFPKGRKNSGEAQVMCAVREFEEETHINRNIIQVWDMPSLTENFIGSDNRPYSTVYYIAEYKPVETPLTQEECKLPSLIETPKGIRKYTASNEAFRIKWFSFEDALEKLPPFRQVILFQATKHINERLNKKPL